MDIIKRRSPVSFIVPPVETIRRGGWEVVLAYADEDQGPFLVDLSHRPKWDVQQGDLSAIRPFGLAVPDVPGHCRLENGVLVNRMNPTQASVWILDGDEPEPPPEPFLTEVTDGLCLLALIGAKAFSVMEKVSALDLGTPEKEPPFLVQGPVLHVSCQVVVLGRDAARAAVLIALSRGYGQTMAEALLAAGSDLGLCPGGERAFRRRLIHINAQG